ncbi:hypothetical protein BSK59_13635 [Paenibacillus odorifer]|uniref:hypothetical protein n=1 Tax=Paenibacillus odorifer TaxID=189426 RepID=UPI00096CE9DA|nr:hypothetical protein [Paenibacillus odorifer]OME55513.1 hypothetical protein BSK59_13635 [Paenibacillus odorifer]
MGVNTHGYVRKEVTATDIFNVITSKFDKDAKFNVKEDKQGEIGRIGFKYKDEERDIFYCIGTQYPEDEFRYFDGEETYVYLDLNYWGSSVEIMSEIISHFGGWIDENDCDEFGPVYIKQSENFEYSSFVDERDKIVSLLDDNLSNVIKFHIATQIIKHKEKIKELL